MIDLVMLSCNRRRITHVAICELRARTKTPVRLTVMDNGSVDESSAMLEELKADGLVDELILSEANLGVHAGFTRLLNTVTSQPYFVCTDADIIPCSPVDGQDWLSRLVKLADANPTFGAISCRPQIFVGGIPGWDESKELIETPWAGAALRLMNVHAVKSCGGWADVIRPERDGEEKWISSRLREIGFKVGYARDVRCIHLFGQPELGEDPWGYPVGIEHGHKPVSPPVNVYNWDKMGLDWKTCLPKEK